MPYPSLCLLKETVPCVTWSIGDSSAALGGRNRLFYRLAFVVNSIALCAVFLLIILSSEAARADGEELILPTADSVASEFRPDDVQSNQTEYVLSAGLGRGLQLGRLISYVRFDLSALPPSTPYRSTVIEDSKLSLMATSLGLAKTDRRFLVTVRSCDAIEWDEQEITWQNQPCATNSESETSVVIDGAGLPRTYEWNVRRGIARASARGSEAVTFTVFAIPLLNCSRDPLEGRGCPIADEDRVGFVRFASRERQAFGIGAIPHLVVRHTSEPTLLMRIIEVTLSVLSALALAFGVYKTARGLFTSRNAEFEPQGGGKR